MKQRRPHTNRTGPKPVTRAWIEPELFAEARQAYPDIAPTVKALVASLRGLSAEPHPSGPFRYFVEVGWFRFVLHRRDGLGNAFQVVTIEPVLPNERAET